MKKKLGILIICPFFRPNIGGVETHLDNLCEYLRQRHEVYVLTYQPVTTKACGASLEKKEGLEIHRYSWPGFNLFHKLEPYPVLEFLYLTPYLFLRAFLFLAVNSIKIDIIHAQGFNSALIAKILGKLFGIRVVVSIHAVYEMDKNSFFAKMVKWTLKDADRILTLSQSSKKELAGIGFSPEKIQVYTYWVNQEVFKPQDKETVKKELGWQDKFVIFFVGRLIEKKGVRLILEMTRDTKLPIFFAIAGDGPMAGEIQKEAENNPKIIFVGKINNQDLPLYYNGADLLIIPSLYEEGFGRVILEALSCGLPVLGSNLGGIPEAVDSSVGILVEPTLENFQKSIEELYNNKEKLQDLAKNCRAYAQKHFSDKNAKLIEESYIK